MVLACLVVAYKQYKPQLVKITSAPLYKGLNNSGIHMYGLLKGDVWDFIVHTYGNHSS